MGGASAELVLTRTLAAHGGTAIFGLAALDGTLLTDAADAGSLTGTEGSLAGLAELARVEGLCLLGVKTIAYAGS